MGQLAKKWVSKEKWLDSVKLAMIDNYHLPRKNVIYFLLSSPTSVGRIGLRSPGTPAT